MSTLDNFKKAWAENPSSATPTYDQATLERLARGRVKKHMTSSMQYFWASFTLQLLVYAMLSHVLIKYGSDPTLFLMALAGILLYIPFTIMLMRYFKRTAILKPAVSKHEVAPASSLNHYIRHKHHLLQRFYTFKIVYELLPIPLISAIGVYITFQLFVPGGVAAYPTGTIITFAITLASCAAAIYAENKKSFQQPLHQLKELLQELEA